MYINSHKDDQLSPDKRNNPAFPQRWYDSVPYKGDMAILRGASLEKKTENKKTNIRW